MATPKLEENGKTWGIRAFRVNRFGEREQKYKGGFRTQSLAIAWEREWKNEFQNATSLQTFNQFFPYFMDLKDAEGISPRTRMDYLVNYEIIKNEFGNMNMSEITPYTIQTFLNSFKKTPTKCRHLKSALSAMLNVAYKQSMIESNPIDRITVPKYERKEIQCYDDKQANELLKILKQEQPQYYVFALVLILTGTRPNEATVLVESDIRKVSDKLYDINIARALSEVYNPFTKETVREIKKPKTKSGNRVIPFNAKMLNELYYFKTLHKIKSDYIICDLEGKPTTLNAFYQALKRTITKHDLPYITPYGLRHTFGNLNKRAGVDSYTVSRLMGHSDPTITEQNYYHDDKVLNQQAIAKLTAFFENQFDELQ